MDMARSCMNQRGYAWSVILGQVWTKMVLICWVWTHKVMLGWVLEQSEGGLGSSSQKHFICATLPTLYILSYSCVAALHTNGKPSTPLLIHILILLWLTLHLICWMASWGLVFQAWHCKPSFGACDPWFQISGTLFHLLWLQTCSLWHSGATSV